MIRLIRYVRIPRDVHRRKITRKAVLARDAYTCQYCGHEASGLTVDHVIPRSRGGQSVWENIVAACAPCNRKKGNRMPREALDGARRAGRGPPARPCSSGSRPRGSRWPGSRTWSPPDRSARPLGLGELTRRVEATAAPDELLRRSGKVAASATIGRTGRRLTITSGTSSRIARTTASPTFSGGRVPSAAGMVHLILDPSEHPDLADEAGADHREPRPASRRARRAASG